MPQPQSQPPTNTVPLMPPPEKSLNEARQQYAEQYGSALVTNRYLLVAVFGLTLVSLGALALSFRIYSALEEFKPLVIRIDEVGRAEAVPYGSMTYRPQAAEIRYVLSLFVHDYYSRNRATLREDFARSLFFLDPRLASARMEEFRKSKEIEKHIVSADEDIEIAVKNIVLQDLRTSPFRAAVDFEKVYLSPSDRGELRREKYVASLVFSFRDNVPNEVIPVNPLGLTITYFREDQAFSEGKR